MKKEGRKRNWKKILLIVVAVVVVLAVGVAGVGYYAANKAFSILTGSLYGSSSVQETTLFENKTSAETDGNQTEGTGENASAAEGGSAGGSGGDNGGENGEGASPSATESTLGALKERLGIPASTPLSGDMLKKLESAVPLSDKLAVMAIISQALSADDYQTLFAMTGGGITSEEAAQAYAILRRSLSDEDKDKIYGYYAKYSHLLTENE